MISADQARQYLDQTLGITVPGFVLSAAIEEVEAVEQAMVDAAYSDSVMIRVQAMAVALIAAAGAPRRLSNQGAPSGASRAFKYADKDMTALRAALAALDTAGTVSALIGPDPSSPSLLLVV